MNWIIVAVLLAIGVTLFVLPHHFQGDLTGASLSLAHDFGDLLTSEIQGRPAELLVRGLIGIGCIAVLLPAALAMALTLAGSGASRTILIVGGLMLVATGVTTLFVELVSNMTIGFGGGGSKYPETMVAYLAPSFPIVCGVVALVMGIARVGLP